LPFRLLCRAGIYARRVVIYRTKRGHALACPLLIPVLFAFCLSVSS
jgi:hypothetical protein